MRFLVVTMAALLLISCSRDPNAAKRRYLENGDKYFARGKYKEASIMYRNALQKDQRFGPAYYKLAETDMKLGRIPNALGELRRAIELIPKDQPEHLDAEIKLAEIYLAFTREPQYLAEVEQITKELLQRNTDSFDGHRLTGDLDFVRAQASLSQGHPDQTRTLLETAIAEYRKAYSVKRPSAAMKIQLGRALAADRQFPEAEQIYKQVISEDKTLTLAYTELYAVYLSENKLADAEQILKSGAAANPKQVNFLITLAGFYSTQKRHDDMIAVLNQIKNHAKDYNRAYLVVGDFYYRNGDLAEALKQYQEGITADSKEKPTYQKRMIEVLMRQHRRQEAADINNAILKDNPKDADARGLQASFLLDKGDLQRAISELQAVVSAAPDNFVARYNLGRAHIARNEWEQARQQFTQAIQQRPDYMPARLALAQLQVLRGENDAALRSVADILKLDPKNGPIRMIQAAALLGEKRYGEARALLEAMKKSNPNAPDIDYSLGMVSLREGKNQEAEQIFRRAYEANPKDARGVVGLIESMLAQNQNDQAVQFLQGEIAKYPKRDDLKMALGNVAVRSGNFDLAVQQYEAVLNEMDKNSRGRGEVYFRLGLTLRKKGDLNGAILALAKAKDSMPENSMVVEELALALQNAKRNTEARQTYEQAVKLDPQNGYALNNLAFLMSEGGPGDLDQALSYAQRAKTVLPNLGEVSDTMGWIYLKKNMSSNALDIFQSLVDKAPSNPTYRYHLAMAYQQKGDKPHAIKELQQALHNSPQKDEEAKIRDLLSKLQS